MIRLGITGTDTGVGKTVVTSALTAWLRHCDYDAVAMKPIETGMHASDGEILRGASDDTATLDEIAPIRFSEPLAPAVAAKKSGAPIDINKLDRAFEHLVDNRDAILVEGAGGIVAPIDRRMSYAGLFRRWELPVIIIAANKLGTINHTLLTTAAARGAGLEVLAIVLNDLPPTFDDLSRASNRESLQDLIEDVPVVSFPTVENPRDISQLVRALESSGLGKLILDRDTHTDA